MQAGWRLLAHTHIRTKLINCLVTKLYLMPCECPNTTHLTHKATAFIFAETLSAHRLSVAGSTVYIPSFDGTSYLELQPLASLLEPPAAAATDNLTSAAKDAAVTLHLTVKTRATQGTILYSECMQTLLKPWLQVG